LRTANLARSVTCERIDQGAGKLAATTSPAINKYPEPEARIVPAATQGLSPVRVRFVNRRHAARNGKPPSLSMSDVVLFRKFVILLRETKAMASGRFVLRIEPGLHAALRSAAEDAGLSLNEYCARKLAARGARVGEPEAAVVERSLAAFGDDLAGIVVFGSWSRGEALPGSDVDVLVIVDGRVALRRSVYLDWDRSPLLWGERRVETHIVQLPQPGTRPTGLWAEAAVDGAVLYERGYAVTRWLIEVRRRIADGHLVRRRSHGQAYWVEAA
jgi:predicted nucleotidyltransferase